MKALKFFAFILFVLFVVNSLQAQNPNVEGTKTVVWVMPDAFGRIPIFCDGEQVDMLRGSGFKLLFREHYKEGVLTKMIISPFGKIEYTSSNEPYEVFTLSAGDRWEVSKGTYYTHFNAKGNMGTHYTGHLVFDPADNFKVVEARVNCH
jgi:hypothetical protein